MEGEAQPPAPGAVQPNPHAGTQGPPPGTAFPAGPSSMATGRIPTTEPLTQPLPPAVLSRFRVTVTPPALGSYLKAWGPAMGWQVPHSGASRPWSTC